MLELIARLRALLDSASMETGGDLIPLRGCHDLLLAMEERVGTIRCYAHMDNGQRVLDVLERA